MKWLLPLMVAIAAVVLVLLGISIGISVTGRVSLLGDTIPGWIAALSTFAIAVLTVILARETWALRELQLNQIENIRKDGLKPSISVQLASSKAGIHFMNMTVKNNGKGSAHNVSFEFENINGDSDEVYNEVREQLSVLGFLESGVMSLGPGEVRETFALDLLRLSDKYPKRFTEFRARVIVTSDDWEGSTHTNTSYIDFSELAGFSQIGTDPLQKLADKLEQLSNDVGRLLGGTHRIKTDVFDREDRINERADRDRELEERRAQQKAQKKDQ